MPVNKILAPKIPSQLNWQLRVPPELPGILKEYTKAILREQPFDVLEFSAKYFQEMSEAVRNRTAESRLTTGQVTKQGKMLDFILLQQLKDKLEITKITGDISVESVEKAWAELELANVQLRQIISVGDLYHGKIPALKLMGLCAAAVSSHMNETMFCFCTLFEGLLDENPEEIPVENHDENVDEILDGIPAINADGISVETFEECYRFLAKIDGDIPNSVVNRAMKFVEEEAQKTENGLVTSKIFEVPTCPRFQ